MTIEEFVSQEKARLDAFMQAFTVNAPEHAEDNFGLAEWLDMYYSWRELQ